MTERPTTCLSYATAGLMSSSDTRGMDCQCHADHPYAFTVSNKLLKLIWAHVFFHFQ